MTELEWIEIFANNLIDILDEYEMSQRELAFKCGISEAAMSSYVNKQKMPSLKTIVNMSFVLGITTDDLIFFGEKIK